MTKAPEQPARSTNPARKRAPAAARVEGDPATAAAVARRTFRELLDSLPLGHQFRLVVMLSVAVALLAAQFVTVLWAGWFARHDAASFARTLPPAIAAAYDQGRGADLLGRAARHPSLVSVTLIMPSGEILRQYVRGDQSTRNRATVPVMDAGLHHRIMRLLALEPIPLELPVQLRPNLSASMIAVLDHQAVWSAVRREITQLPIALAIGMLLAFLGANSLKRHVVEPLAQLASATRVGTWGPGAQQGSALRRRNELNQLASNFDALADRLAEYERDFRNVRLESGQQIIERTRELEMRLRAAEAMTRSKDEFLANMSHEIRTPMNGVLGMAELLAGTELDKRQRRFVESMRTAAETMMQIINDILDDSKIEAGKMDLVREPFDVRELVEQAGQLFAGAAERKSLELICRVEPTVPHGVVGDVLRLRQVLGNLLSNAVKYTERGEMEVRVAD